MDLSDEALIEKYKKTGDMTQFKALVRRYQNRVYSAAVRILGNTEEADDVVQDTFVKVHQNLGKFRHGATFSAWVFRICHNQCMDLIRLRQRRDGMMPIRYDPQSVTDRENPNDTGLVVSQLADPTPGPEEKVDLTEREHMIASSINQLPESQREVLVLHDIEGFSYQEISDIVGASIGTVRSRLHYGRLKLRELLEPYFSHSMSPSPR